LATFLFNRYKGNIPMCPTQERGNKIYCPWLKEWLSKRRFRKACKLCQKEIMEILEKEGEE